MSTDVLAPCSDLRAATVELVNAAIATRRYLGELADLLRPTSAPESLAQLARAIDELDGTIAAAQGLL